MLYLIMFPWVLKQNTLGLTYKLRH